jgi:(2Fe-2S) ferredoxin
MRQKGQVKKKLRKKLLAKLGPIAAGDRVIVVCVGEDCASREENRATFAEAKKREAAARDPHVRVHCYGCLKVCKKGTVVAVLPEALLYRRVHPEDAAELVEGPTEGDQRGPGAPIVGQRATAHGSDGAPLRSGEGH